MTDARSNTYLIDLGRPEAVDSKVLNDFTREVMSLPCGGKMASGNHRVNGFFGFFARYFYTLTNDVINYGNIDLANVTKDNAHVLGLLLQERYVGQYLPAGSHYLYDNNQYYHIVTTKDAYVRKDDYGNIVCDVINKEDLIGEGGFADVYGYSGSLKYRLHKNKKLKFEPNENKRAVKLGNERFESGNDYETSVKNEHYFMRQCPHLGVRHLFFGKIAAGKILSAIFMRKLQGKDLFDYIVQDIKDEPALSLHDRFQLTIEILHRLRSQVHRRGLVHRDVKPENILVSKHAGRWYVYYIDYNLSRLIRLQDRKSCGTESYVAMEAMIGDLDESSDIFSAGLIIALLWRDQEQTTVICMDNERDEVLRRREKCDWNIPLQLFARITGLSDDCKSDITKLLELIICKNKSGRITLDECIAKIEAIYFKHKLASIPVAHQDNATTGYELGMKTRQTLDRQAELTIDNLQSIRRLRDDLIVEVSKLPDDAYAIREFIAVSGVKCLHGMTTKATLLDKIKDVTEQFIKAYQRTDNLCMQLQQISAGVGALGLLSSEQQKRANELTIQIAQHKIFEEKINKSSLDFDVIDAQNAHLVKKNSKIEHTMVYFGGLKPVKVGHDIIKNEDGVLCLAGLK